MKINNKWFTLIELTIVITIIWLMMSMAYAPYNYFQKKAQVKIAAKEISKTISESRNMAIHWISSTWSWNLSIWVYFDTTNWNNNIIKIFAYPYSYWTGSQIVLNNDYLLKEIKIQKYMQIDKINDNNKVLLLFDAITWNWNYFSFDSWKEDLIISENKIKIDFSYYWATTWLKSFIVYYTKTYISDY